MGYGSRERSTLELGHYCSGDSEGVIDAPDYDGMNAPDHK